MVVMRQLLLYCCNSTREPLLELKFPVCIASSNTYQVAYSIFHEFVLMVNISQMLNNPFRWYYGTVVGIMRQHFLYMLLHSLFMHRTLLSLFMFVHGKLYKLWQPSHNKYMSIFIRTVSIMLQLHIYFQIQRYNFSLTIPPMFRPCAPLTSSGA